MEKPGECSGRKSGPWWGVRRSGCHCLLVREESAALGSRASSVLGAAARLGALGGLRAAARSRAGPGLRRGTGASIPAGVTGQHGTAAASPAPLLAWPHAGGFSLYPVQISAVSAYACCLPFSRHAALKNLVPCPCYPVCAGRLLLGLLDSLRSPAPAPQPVPKDECCSPMTVLGAAELAPVCWCGWRLVPQSRPAQCSVLKPLVPQPSGLVAATAEGSVRAERGPRHGEGVVVHLSVSARQG